MAWKLRRKASTGVIDLTAKILAGTVQWARLVRTADGTVDLYLNGLTGVAAHETILVLEPGFRAGWTRRLTSSAASGYAYTDATGAVKHSTAITTGSVVISGLYVTPDAMP